MSENVTVSYMDRSLPSVGVTVVAIDSVKCTMEFKREAGGRAVVEGFEGLKLHFNPEESDFLPEGGKLADIQPGRKLRVQLDHVRWETVSDTFQVTSKTEVKKVIAIYLPPPTSKKASKWERFWPFSAK